MAADPLDQVLRLVAEGRLTAEEAAPILAALDEQGPSRPAAGPAPAGPSRPRGSGSTPRPAPPSGPARTTEPGPGRPSSTLRIQVRDAGRNVVNLRLPLAVGRFALDRVPGLSERAGRPRPRGDELRLPRTRSWTSTTTATACGSRSMTAATAGRVPFLPAPAVGHALQCAGTVRLAGRGA